MHLSTHRSLFARLSMLILFSVFINAATYILVLPQIAGGRASYYPFVGCVSIAMFLAIKFAWRGVDPRDNKLFRTIRCFSSAVMVGAAVVLLSLFIIVNIMGS